MGLFRRRPKLPAAHRPALEADERVLAWAATSGDGAVVATNRGLWLPGLNRLGWHEINKAAWSGRELRVTPAQVCEERDGYTVVADQPVIPLLLVEPGDLPHQVRTRVTGSVAYTVHYLLPAGGGVRVVARRVSGVDGLSWTVRYDVGASVTDPAVIGLTGELVARARHSAEPSPESLG
jgi:hypothetical protein